MWRIRPGNLQTPVSTDAATAPEQIDLASGLRVDPSSPAPVQLKPKDGASISVFPRNTIFTVRPVRGALGYQIEFAGQDVSLAASSTTPHIQFDAPGVGNYTWRAWAIFPDGLRSAASTWRKITYLR